MSWTDEYKEIVEFYYWEPQHIGRAKGVRRFDGPKDMWSHVNKLEISLNHILSLFFSLYSGSLLFDKIGAHGGPYLLTSSGQLEEWSKETKGFVQPDLFFKGDNKNLAIELKLDSKTDLSQISKYVALNGWTNQDKPLDLIFLTPHNNLKKVTKEKYVDYEELINELRDVELHKKIQSACSQNLYQEQVDMLAVNCLSFSEFYRILQAIKPESATEEKLLSGLIHYLHGRSLT